MYTVDDEKNDIYEDEYVETSNWDNNKGLVFKIIIIILCIIVLIWLIKALKGSRTYTDNGEIHAANTEKIRLAAEDYFFIKNNKDNTKYVTLAGLKNNGLIGDVVDANNKVCNENGTTVNLDHDVDAYKMTIDFSCSTNDKDEVFYYHNNTLACLNCNGKTNMNGREVVIADNTKTEVIEDNGGNEDVSDDIQYNNDEYSYYSCIDWSDWSKDRVFDSSLTERTKTLVQGVKYGNKTAYGEWSEYTTTPIVSSDNVEVETKVETASVWSENKTGRDIDTNNSNIRVISSEIVNETSNSCANGYVVDNTCYSNNVTIGNLTFKEYNSGKYKVKKDYCEGVKTLQNSEGLYVLTYVNCEYNEIINNEVTNNSYMLYTYQELVTTDVTYYRYRTINSDVEADVYTDVKYEESDLPEGFVKVPGSEETYYSYKLTYCEK